MISVEDATARLFSLVDPMPVEEVGLADAMGRVLARPIAANHAQPPFAASAMDGYAVTDLDPAPGDRFRVIGEAAAGRPFAGTVAIGEAVRIFTGAVVPEGATRVIIQEDVSRDGDRITLGDALDPSTYIRPAGGDFDAGFRLGPRRLGSRDIALAASMGHSVLPCAKRPDVAILMTGDELRAPGQDLAPGEIVASNGYGLAAMLGAHGAIPRILPFARDTPESLATAFDLARGADLIVTIGGASVGDHDLIAQTAGTAGLDLAFHKVAMRPGKPLLAGRLDNSTLIGLPGNPVSAMVCGVVFILPTIRLMLGLDPSVPTVERRLGDPLSENGPRQHYMRARDLGDGTCAVDARQDSALLGVLARSDILVLRPPGDPARAAGDVVTAIPFPH
ncbi:molybdopterin molybdotransferase MoeA [Jannaschia sp. KMU-145]|uniref:molybdopterin molybdotransferase MoeA n=1 Tax=Jannaschia halovivens TaxID=3388667 RepID=UPI00396B206A